MTKKLHELIEMALDRKKFLATNPTGASFTQDYFAAALTFQDYEVRCDWTVRMKREPRVMYSVEVEDGILEGNFFTREIAEKYGKPIKFIEVIE